MLIGNRPRPLAAGMWMIVLACGGVNAAPGEGDWPSFGNDPGGSQYSPLDQINAANVGKLELVWTHHSGDVSGAGTPTGATALEAIPIHVNGTLYTCTPFNRVIALDPATGKEKWAFDPHAGLIKAPRKSGICRSVAYWQAETPTGAACEKRIFKGDINGNIFAIDADTGKACADFGAAKGHPGYVSHADFDSFGTGDNNVGMTSGPAVVGDILVAAANARDSLTDANDGMVRAFDVRTGELKWEFDPIPPEHRHETGAANVWSTISVDPARNLVFVPTTSPSPDYYGGNRQYDIPLADATVALNAENGQPVWWFQATHHDLFDYDLPGHPLLVTITKDGAKHEVAIQQTKQGRAMVFDRDTGVPIFPVEERAVGQSTLPGEKSSPTQPFPVLPEPFSRQELTEDDMWGLAIFDRMWCKARFKELRYEGAFTPPDERGSLVYPFGGGNWGGVAYDPKHNMLVAKGSNLALKVNVRKKRDDESANLPPYQAQVGLFTSPLGAPCTPPPFATMTGIDMDTGKVKWQVPLGQSKYFGITAPAFFDWGSPVIGGPIVTGGGLVFVAAALDSKLRALDVTSGKELWQHDIAAPGMTIPMTYMAGGRQFIVISAGGNARASDELSDATMAFALPLQSK